MNMIETFNIVRKFYYLILAIIGVPVNLLGIVILSRGKCGLSNCITRYLVAMATADLMFISIGIIPLRVCLYFSPGLILHITPVCRMNSFLQSAVTDLSVWFTVTFSFDRFVAICCKKLKTKYCTKKTAAVVLAITSFLLCVKNTPYYFIYEPRMIIDGIPWHCTVKPNSYIDAWWVAFDWFDTVLIPLIPFALILLVNTLTVRHILVASRVRNGLRGQSNGEIRGDPEMESRRKSVILLLAISGNFILLWLVNVIEFIYYNIQGTDPADYTPSEYIFEQVGEMLLNLSCCTNIFIYAVTQCKFREQLKNAMKYPITTIIQLMKKQNN